jgi:hypothetical protein
MTAPGFALHFREPEPWVKVEVLPAAVAVSCSRCRGTSWAYMVAVRTDAALVDRLVELHAGCLGGG